MTIHFFDIMPLVYFFINLGVPSEKIHQAVLRYYLFAKYGPLAQVIAIEHCVN